MEHAIEIEVVAADRKVYSGRAVSLMVPGGSGYFGVLHGHAPLISTLAVGEVTITPVDEPPVLLAVSAGFVEVTPDRATILADTAELAEEIDVQRARQARERAEARLRERTDEIDYQRAEAALTRAINRLRVVERRG